MVSPVLDLTIVVPVLHEREGTQWLLTRIDAWKIPWSYEIVFVDGGSQDGTVELLRASQRENIRALFLPAGSGIAAAWRTGLAQARGRVRATMDGDGVHELQSIEALVREVERGTDLAIASRYGPGGIGMPGRPWAERAGSYLAARAWSARFNLPFWDPLHGLRARSLRAYEGLRGQLEQVDGNVWLGWECLRAYRNGMRVAEMVLPYGRRLAGCDKKSLLHQGWHMARALAFPEARLSGKSQ